MRLNHAEPSTCKIESTCVITHTSMTLESSEVVLFQTKDMSLLMLGIAQRLATRSLTS